MWSQLENLTRGMSTRGFDDLDDIWMETVMARERVHHPTLHRVALVVVAAAPILALGASVGPKDHPGRAHP